MTRAISLLLIVATACGSSESAASSAADERAEKLAGLMLEMTLKVRAALESATGNCDVAAGNLEKLSAEAKVIRDGLVKLGVDGKVDAALRTAWEKQGPMLQAAIGAGLASLKPILDRCSGNPAFQRAKQHAGFLFKKS